MQLELQIVKKEEELEYLTKEEEALMMLIWLLNLIDPLFKDNFESFFSRFMNNYLDLTNLNENPSHFLKMVQQIIYNFII